MVLAAVAAVAALLAAPVAQAKGGGKNLFGLNYSFKEISGKDASMLKKSGAKTVRWIMFWPRIETSSGHFDWSVPDKFVGDLAAKGIKVLPIMWGSPRWVEHQAITPPLNTQAARDAWQGFLKAAVKRYGPGGKFWRKSFKKGHHKKKPLPDHHLGHLERAQPEGRDEPSVPGSLCASPAGPGTQRDHEGR